MRTIHKDYRPVLNNASCNNLKIHLYYDKGGYNYFSSNAASRGIYLSVTPVTKTKSACGRYSSETVTAFTGTKVLLEEKARWSKSLENYIAVLDKNNLEALINHVCKVNNIKL